MAGDIREDTLEAEIYYRISRRQVVRQRPGAPDYDVGAL